MAAHFHVAELSAPSAAARTRAATRLVELMGEAEDAELFVARLLRAGALLPLLRMAQAVRRNADLSPHASSSSAAVLEADAGLIALSQLALLATELLGRFGWEVAPDEESGRLAFAHEASGIAQLATPSLPPAAGVRGGWARELLLDTISLTEPLGVDSATGEVRWPVRVVAHTPAVSVVDVAMDGGDEAQGATVRQLIRGVWQGVDGPRVAELDLAEEPGAQLETWEATTTAALLLARLAAAADADAANAASAAGAAGIASEDCSAAPRVLLVGLGGGVLASFLARHAPAVHVDVLEPSAEVVAAARAHFGTRFVLLEAATPQPPTARAGQVQQAPAKEARAAGSKRPRGELDGGQDGEGACLVTVYRLPVRAAASAAASPPAATMPPAAAASQSEAQEEDSHEDSHGARGSGKAGGGSGKVGGRGKRAGGRKAAAAAVGGSSSAADALATAEAEAEAEAAAAAAAQVAEAEAEEAALCVWLDAALQQRAPQPPSPPQHGVGRAHARYGVIVIDLPVLTARLALSPRLSAAVGSLASADGAEVLVVCGALPLTDEPDAAGGPGARAGAQPAREQGERSAAAGVAAAAASAQTQTAVDDGDASTAAAVRARATAVRSLLARSMGAAVASVHGYVDWQGVPSLRPTTAELAALHCSVFRLVPCAPAGGNGGGGGGSEAGCPAGDAGSGSGSGSGKGGRVGSRERAGQGADASGAEAEAVALRARWERTLAWLGSGGNGSGSRKGGSARACLPFTLDEVAALGTVASATGAGVEAEVRLIALSWAEDDEEEDEEEDEEDEGACPPAACGGRERAAPPAKAARTGAASGPSGGSSAAWALFGGEEEEEEGGGGGSAGRGAAGGDAGGGGALSHTKFGGSSAAGAARTAQPRPSLGAAPAPAQQLADASFWSQLARGTPAATIASSVCVRPPPEGDARSQLARALEADGYVVYPPADNGNMGGTAKSAGARASRAPSAVAAGGRGGGSCGGSARDGGGGGGLRSLVRLMAVLRAHPLSLPPVFAFMYDATWSAVYGMWDFAEALLGCRCLLEPSLAAFKLDHAQTKAGRRYVGNNFGRPHRDYGRAEALDADGRARVLSVWLPLNDVTLHNGCMYVVPRAHDASYDSAHQGALAPDVPLGGVRALAPHGAGTLMAWNGNVIHWGSACEREGALDPRASLALVFRRADVEPDPSAPPISRAQALAMGPAERLRLVGAALRFFSAWYEVPKELAALLKEAGAGPAATCGRESGRKH